LEENNIEGLLKVEILLTGFIPAGNEPITGMPEFGECCEILNEQYRKQACDV